MTSLFRFVLSQIINKKKDQLFKGLGKLSCLNQGLLFEEIMIARYNCIFGGMDNMEDIELPINQQEQDLQILEAEQYEQLMEQNSQRMIALQDNQAAADNIPQEIKVAKKPSSAYMVFVGSWKQKHPQEKLSFSAMGQIWKAMTLAQKEPFETEYQARRKRYEEYVTIQQIQNPNMNPRESLGKFLIPLNRIKSILHQDQFYSAKNQAIPAMAKAVQYFAEYLLEQVKRMSQGKNRIDHGLLYDCINNQRSFSFLECLIEQHNRDGSQAKDKKNKPEIRLVLEQSQKKTNKVNSNNPNKIQPQPSFIKKTNQGQMSLDSYFSKQR